MGKVNEQCKNRKIQPYLHVCLAVCNSLPPHGLQPTRLLCPWDFPGKNTGVGCHFLLQGIFPTQGSLKSIYRFNAISRKLSSFWRNSKLILKFLWKCKEPRRAKTILENENKSRDSNFSISELTTKLHQSGQYIQAQERHTNQWNRIESKEIHLWSVDLQMAAETIQWRK